MTAAAPTISTQSKPQLARGVRLTHSEAQGGWVLLAPERIFQTDAVAAEILKRCTGDASLAAVVDDLVQAYGAPREQIARDVEALLASLAEKKLIEFGDA
jgi:pyrroloquinoline quinone biosynthesis protein D